MKLDRIHEKVQFALGAISNHRDDVRHPAGLWYHTIALFNCFYALTEELVMAQNTKDDPLLCDAVRVWRTANGETVQSFFGKARNTATHQGEVHMTGHLQWEPDYLNDTVHPRQRSTLTVSGSLIKDMPEDQFLALCDKALSFLKQGVIDIDADYRRRGGSKNGIREREPYGYDEDF